MKTFNSLLLTAAVAMACSLNASAQIVKSQIVEDGGTGPYKAMIVSEETLPTHTVFRPQDIKAAVAKGGKLPVILYANGACANSTVEIRYTLSELASYGYIAIGIGPYDEEDFFTHWADVMRGMYPEGKGKVILANGQEVKPMTAEEKAELEKNIQAMIAADKAKAEAAKNKKPKKNEPAPVVNISKQPTNPGQLLEAMNWITEQNANPKSEYYHMIDLDQVAVMGQSCGGSQALAVAHDPRIKTCVILNSGFGDMEMQGANSSQLANLHTPMFYLIGGPEDIAYPNAQKDYEKINNVPIVMANTIDGHEGTYYEKSGGLYAIAIRKWLDWNLKGDISQSAAFLDSEIQKLLFPSWTFVRKNF